MQKTIYNYFLSLKFQFNSYSVSVLRITYGLLFIFSGLTKFLNIPSFQDAIKNFAIVPDRFVFVFSYLIPISELFIGVFFVFNLYTLINSQFAIYLLTIFTSAILVSIVEGANITCSCFGALSADNINAMTVLRNIILISISFFLWYQTEKKSNTLDKMKLKKKAGSFSIIIILIFFIVLNSVFAIRNIELKNRIMMLLDKEILGKGELVENFTFYRVNGSIDKMNFSNYDKTLLFIMKYGCKPCKENIRFWEKISKEFERNNRVKVLGITFDSFENTRKFLIEYSPRFELAYNDTEEFKNNFRLYITPVTLIINNQNEIEDIFKGIIHQSQVKYIINKL